VPGETPIADPTIRAITARDGVAAVTVAWLAGDSSRLAQCWVHVDDDGIASDLVLVGDNEQLAASLISSTLEENTSGAEQASLWGLRLLDAAQTLYLTGTRLVYGQPTPYLIERHNPDTARQPELGISRPASMALLTALAAAGGDAGNSVMPWSGGYDWAMPRNVNFASWDRHPENIAECKALNALMLSLMPTTHPVVEQVIAFRQRFIDYLRNRRFIFAHAG
jgi:hypothetical protein